MKKKIRINIFLQNSGKKKRVKKKNNYPENRKPAEKKECPYCHDMRNARELHLHVLRTHGIKLPKASKVISPDITKVNEVITSNITKANQVIQRPATKDMAGNLSNSVGNSFSYQPNELLDKETITWYHDSLQECIEAIFPKLKVFLEAYDIFNRFWKSELREEINLLSATSPSFRTRSHSGDYYLTVTIEYLDFNDDLHPYARFRVKEFTGG